MKLLNSQQIRQKIKRLSIEILEHNYGEDEIIIAGINNTGLDLAQEIKNHIDPVHPGKVRLTQIKLSPAQPLEQEVHIGLPLSELKHKIIIIVDDVANTGRTIFYAIKPLLEILPKKVEVAVLVDRKHKSFPIKVDYVGLSLATTIQENIDVRWGEEPAVYLE